jgi:hypothetical protein
VTFRWDPSRLNAAIARGNLVSFKVAHEDALARRKAKTKTGIDLDISSSNVATMEPRGLQAMFEKGRRGGYAVSAGGKPMPIGGGKFASAVTGGPMRAYPAMGPASQTWARGGYNTVARKNLQASGFV